MSAPHGMGPPMRRKKPRRKQPEQIFQRQVADFLDLALPRPDAWFTAIPAGAPGKLRGAIMQGMGYTPGTPDMVVIYKWLPPIWLELKSAGGGLSKAQEQCRKDLGAAGCCWALCRTLEDVERALKRFGVPLRASVGGVAGEGMEGFRFEPHVDSENPW